MGESLISCMDCGKDLGIYKGSGIVIAKCDDCYEQT